LFARYIKLAACLPFCQCRSFILSYIWQSCLWHFQQFIMHCGMWC